MPGRSLEPRLRALRARRTGPEARLGIAGRIEQALNMTAVGEHEGAALTVELRCAVAALPGRDVIGQPADDVAVKVESAHVERHAAHLQPPRIDEWIGVDEIEEVGM